MNNNEEDMEPKNISFISINTKNNGRQQQKLKATMGATKWGHMYIH